MSERNAASICDRLDRIETALENAAKHTPFTVPEWEILDKAREDILIVRTVLEAVNGATVTYVR